MSSGGEWWRPRPRPEGGRYAPMWVLAGGVTGTLATIWIPVLGVFLGGLAVLTWLGILAPLVVGIALAATPGTPARQGFGLGMVIGWALAPIVFAGVCIFFTISGPRLAGTAWVAGHFGP